MPAKLFAISDLHVGYPANRAHLDALVPQDDGDWLIVAGDVSERADPLLDVLETLTSRFSRVIWAPGNHELWTMPGDPVQLQGRERYDYLVRCCRELGVRTPEDPFLQWRSDDEMLTIAPLFLLYDYSFRAPGTTTKAESLAAAYASGVVCTDERFLSPAPFATREAWCAERVAYSAWRLAEIEPPGRTVLINHWPLHRHPTDILHFPEFAQWCGTELTADWHVRFRAEAVVYGHLHIPRRTFLDGVRFEEVSLGYPTEWSRRAREPQLLRQILPAPPIDDGFAWEPPPRPEPDRGDRRA